MNILHIKANYADIEETITHGHYMRSSTLLKMFTQIIQSISNNQPTIFKIRIKRLRGKTPTKENTLPLSIAKKETLKIALARIKLISHIVPRVVVDELLPILREGNWFIVVDDYATLEMLGWDGINILIESGNPVIYVSHNFYNLPKDLAERESYLMKKANFTVAATKRDYYIYLKNYGPANILVYPNIYPVYWPPNNPQNLKIETERKTTPTIVLNMGSKVHENICEKFVKTINSAVQLINHKKPLKIMIIGDKLLNIARRYRWGCEIEAIQHIPDRLRFIEQLSTAHVGVNYAYKDVGSNIKKYDYALAGLTVLSNTLGSKGELIPHEWVFHDEQDFITKLDDLLDMDHTNMGRENRKHVLTIAHNSYNKLREAITSIIKQP